MIKLSENKGFEIIPEGKTILKITNVKYDKDFGKMIIKMADKSGIAHTERFSLINQSGEVNEKALNAFSWFARTALDTEATEIDEQELVGCYIGATCTHVKYEGTGQYAGKTYTKAQLSDYEIAKGFDGANSTQQKVTIDI